jgi:hypothetical protein
MQSRLLILVIVVALAAGGWVYWSAQEPESAPPTPAVISPEPPRSEPTPTPAPAPAPDSAPEPALPSAAEQELDRMRQRLEDSDLNEALKAELRALIDVAAESPALLETTLQQLRAALGLE